MVSGLPVCGLHINFNLAVSGLQSNCQVYFSGKPPLPMPYLACNIMLGLWVSWNV